MRGIWSDAQHEAAQEELQQEVLAAQKQAESHGTLLDGHMPPLETMFEQVYEHMPPHLADQMAQVRAEQEAQRHG